jgi:hypothetical protein
MSVFSLPEIARVARKNPRTIRRWCEAGRVPGAFQTQGGHWRVRGESPEAILAGCSVEGFARRRRKKRNPWKSVVAFTQRKNWQSLMAGIQAVSAWADSPEQGEEYFALLDAADIRGVGWSKVARCLAWIRQADHGGRLTVRDVASLSGVSLRSFYRRYHAAYKAAMRLYAHEAPDLLWESDGNHSRLVPVA